MYLYFEDFWNEERFQQPKIFPNKESELENRQIAITGHSQISFSVQAINCIASLDIGGRPSQCFPFYTYDEDGSNRRENITDWALAQFQKSSKYKYMVEYGR